jgi:dienelactone hydrolase
MTPTLAAQWFAQLTTPCPAHGCSIGTAVFGSRRNLCATSNEVDSVSAMIVARKAIYNVDGLTMVGHLVHPDGEGRWPAVLIGHDGIGLEDYQRGRADILAERGYIVLAMDYHAGRTYFGEPEAMLARVMPLLADAGRMRAIGRAALEVLLAHPGTDPERLAMVGFGAGGRIMLELAGTGTRVRALAAIHPALPATTHALEWGSVGGAFLLGTGSEDPLCTPKQLLAFTAILQDAGVDWRVNVYGGAQHAFWAAPVQPDDVSDRAVPAHLATVPGVGHHALHATRAWRAVLDLLDETMPLDSRRRP